MQAFALDGHCSRHPEEDLLNLLLTRKHLGTEIIGEGQSCMFLL